MDPLSVLRDYAIRGELDKIVRVGDEFRFGSEYSFPCSAETAYRSKQGNLYTLESLVFFLQNQHARHPEYIQSARLRRVPAVTFPDRKPLLDYLLGRVSSSDAILPLPPSLPPDLNLNPVADLNADVNNDFGSRGSNSHKEFNGKSSSAVDFVAMIRALEKPLKDTEALLECRGKHDFYSVLVASTRREEERQRAELQQRKDGLVAKTRIVGNADVQQRHDADALPKPKIMKGGEGVPIIIVPSASQTLITIYNVKDFLEDGVFVPSDEKMKKHKGARPDCVTVQKKFSRDRDRVVAAFEVRDKPSSFKPEDWDRVVAVFVLGKEWQFKDWPFKDHVEIFNKFIGFYVRFEDDSIESAKVVKQWNVKIISISKNKRHQDRAAALEVWDRLEEFMRVRSHT